MSLASMASVDYLVGHVASGDGRGQRPDSGQGSAWTRYYSADGYPPGRWIGSGLAGLADGRGIPVGAEVTESELRALFEDGVDPVTGELLIRRASARFPTRAERRAHPGGGGGVVHPDRRAGTEPGPHPGSGGGGVRSLGFPGG